MTRFEPIDLSGLHQQPTKKADKLDVPENTSGLSRLLAVALLVIGFMWWTSGAKPGPSPGPTPIDAEGLHVLVVEPADRTTVSKLQNEFVNSVKIAEWVDSKQGQFRRFNENANLAPEAEIWRKMREQADATNRVVVVKDKRPYRMPLPEGVEAGIRALEGIK